MVETVFIRLQDSPDGPHVWGIDIH